MASHLTEILQLQLKWLSRLESPPEQQCSQVSDNKSLSSEIGASIVEVDALCRGVNALPLLNWSPCALEQPHCNVFALTQVMPLQTWNQH